MSQLLTQQTSLLVFLQERVLVPLLQRKASANENLRIWSIGCPAGDEASTLALMVRSLLPAGLTERQITIFATDADPAALAVARDYHYPARLLSHLPETVLPFLQGDSFEYRLPPSLRRQILFGSHSLLFQMPFPSLDLILWYDCCADYTPDQQRHLFNRFASALSPEGYLWLASPAAIDPDSVYYQRQEGAWPLYQRSATHVDFSSLARKRAQPTTASLVHQPFDEREGFMAATVEELQMRLEEREMAYEEVTFRLRDLEQVYHDLGRAEQLKEDALSILSHEINSPLAALLLTIQMLQRRLQGTEQAAENAPAFREWFARDLETIEQMSKQISRLMTDLLEVAQLRSDLFYLSKRPMDLVKLVRGVITKQELVTARRVRFVSGLEQIVGVWDEIRLEQVIGNLLSNALKYSDPSTEVAITLRYRFRSSQAREVLIAVQDQGQGISQEDLPHIFDRFYRASRQREDASGGDGLGLGLYISAEIVKRHGGRIWAESWLGRGSTFFVVLPLMKPETEFSPDVASGLPMLEASVSEHF